MIDAISLTEASVQQDMQRINVIANNAANAMTPGFKRAYLTASSQLDSSLLSSSDQTLSYRTSPVVQSLMTDNRPGVARQTGGSLDLAVLGDGYFEVRTEAGRAYTRQGAFQLDSSGRLVTHDGYPVSGVGGDIILSTPTPIIDREGKIYDQGKQVAQIKLVSFNSLQALSTIGGGLLVASEDSEKQDVQLPRLAQGQLESSNVDSTQEMVRMLETYRHFETSHKVLQAYDDLSDKTFRNLGQF